MLWISFSVIKYKSSFWLELLQSSLLNWCVLTYWNNLLLMNIWHPHFLYGTDKTDIYNVCDSVCDENFQRSSFHLITSLRLISRSCITMSFFFFAHCSFMFINWYSKVPIVCKGGKQVQRREPLFSNNLLCIRYCNYSISFKTHFNPERWAVFIWGQQRI